MSQEHHTETSANKLRLNQWVVDLVSGELTVHEDFDDDTLKTDPQSAVGTQPAVGTQSAVGTQPPASKRIEPQGISLLRILAERPHLVLSKNELISEIWQDVIVTDDALSRVVSRVRKALQDNPKEPKILETLPKRGYRLIASQIIWLEEQPVAADNITPAETQASVISGSAVQSQHINIATTGLNRQVCSRDNLNERDSLVPESPEKGSHFTEQVTPLDLKKWLVLSLVIPLLMLVLLTNNPFDKSPPPQRNKAMDEAESLVERGDDYYAQIRRQDNEMAIELYQQAMAMRPDVGAARAGLANALVQQVLRWQNDVSEQEAPFAGLFAAIEEGRTQTPEAIQKLKRARDFAEQGVAYSPNDPRTHKALGLVSAAQQEFDLAMESYQKAVALNPDAWDSYINMGDMMEHSGDLPTAIEYYIKTFDAMKRVSQEQAVRIRPWHADMGAAIGEKYVQLGDLNEGEVWFRHVLNFAPFNFKATQGLAAVLMKTGNPEAALSLCAQFKQRIGDDPCQPQLSPQ